MTLLLRHNCIPAPHSIFKGIYKLLPGTILTLDYNNSDHISGILPELHKYWSLENVAKLGLSNSLKINGKEALEEFESRLKPGGIGHSYRGVFPPGLFLKILVRRQDKRITVAELFGDCSSLTILL